MILPGFIQDRYGNGSMTFEPSAHQLDTQVSRLGSRIPYRASELELRC